MADTSTSIVLAPQFDSVVPNERYRFPSNMYLVKKDDLYGVYRRDKEILAPLFYNIQFFRHLGIIIGTIKPKERNQTEPILVFDFSGKRVLKDTLLKFEELYGLSYLDLETLGKQEKKSIENLTLISIRTNNNLHSLFSYNTNYKSINQWILKDKDILEIKETQEGFSINAEFNSVRQSTMIYMEDIILYPLDGQNEPKPKECYTLGYDYKGEKFTLKYMSEKEIETHFPITQLDYFSHGFYGCGQSGRRFNTKPSPEAFFRLDDTSLIYILREHSYSRNSSPYILSFWDLKDDSIFIEPRSNEKEYSLMTYSNTAYINSTVKYKPKSFIVIKKEDYYTIQKDSQELNITFDSVYDGYCSNLRLIYKVKHKGKVGLISSDDSWVMEPIFDSIVSDYTKGISHKYYKNGLCGMAGLPCEYDAITKERHSYYLLKNNRYGLYFGKKSEKNIAPIFDYQPKSIAMIDNVVYWKLYDCENQFKGYGTKDGKVFYREK